MRDYDQQKHRKLCNGIIDILDDNDFDYIANALIHVLSTTIIVAGKYDRARASVLAQRSAGKLLADIHGDWDDIIARETLQ